MQFTAAERTNISEISLKSHKMVAMPPVPSPPEEDSPESLAAGEVVARLMQGEEAAATEIFSRYVARLTALARHHMSPRLAVRVDAEDVVMSAYRSFFMRARGGAFTLHHEHDLWRLLVEITLHKLYRVHARHSAARRSTQREESREAGTPVEATSRDAPPEVLVILTDELQHLVREMPAEWRTAFELRLEGHDLDEIAKQLQKSERTIRRWLEQVKGLLRQRFPEFEPALKATPARQSKSSRPVPLSLESFSQQIVLFADYTLKRQVGEGTTGKVYRATIGAEQKSVAIKFLKRAWLNRADVIEKFLQEAKWIAQWEHPHLIHLHGIGRTPNRGYFLAMDWHPCGDLMAQTAQRPILLTTALRWLREAGEAIAFVHERGVLHCDLKPSNLLLADNGRIVVTDFGLARSLTVENESHAIAGTPAFLAPEQFDPQWGQIGPATDVYGLGAILYQLLVGKPPRVGTVEAILESVSCGRKIAVPAGLPRSVSSLLERCLALRPNDRFPTVHEMLSSLPRE